MMQTGGIVTWPGSAAALRERLEDALRPPGLGPGLLAGLDRLKRQALLARWQREFRRDQPPREELPPPD
ncbi:MAG: hypothetical protein ACLFRS_00435 [Halomonas sp.]